MSSPIAFIQPRDIRVVQNTPNNPNAPGDLTIPIPGYCFVMFYANDCGICHQVRPSFLQVASRIPQIKFGMVNVAANNKAVAYMSRKSKTPITKTPIFALYKDGIFQMAYNGPKTPQDMLSNFIQMYQYINSRKPFTQGKTCSTNGGLNTYCAEGYDQEDEGCYVTFDEVFNGQPSGKKQTVVTVQEAFGLS